MMKKRCIALYSGGLDSIVAVKLMEELGIEVIPLYFCTPYFGFEALRNPGAFAAKQSDKYGIKIHVIDFTQDMISIVKQPAHGCGKDRNPCIDCKIGMLRKAKTLLEEMDASFVVTGEVLGQRPMSQRSDTLRVIERESGLQGLLIRPLCAQYLPETLPERAGLMKREDLLGITGRGRKDQIDCALRYGIRKEDIPNAAGGCLLTAKQIASKVRKTLERFSPLLPDKADLVLDVVGRKFMLDQRTVLVVGRDEAENEVLSSLQYEGNVFLRMDEVPGPLCIIRGDTTNENLELAAGICLRYSRAKGESGHDAVYGPDPDRMKTSVAAPFLEEEYCASFQH